MADGIMFNKYRCNKINGFQSQPFDAMNSVGLRDVPLNNAIIKTDSKISKSHTWNKSIDSCGGYEFHTPSRFRKRDKVITTSVLWEGLVEHTTVHGLPDYAKARGPIKRGFWIVAMLLMTAGLCYNLQALTSNYLSYPVAVAITIKQQKQVLFPAVTICNMNAVRKSALEVLDSETKSEKAVERKRKKRGATDGTCSVGWQYYNGFCYFASDPGVLMNCASALLNCLFYGGSLVSIADQNENDFVRNNITANFTMNDYWIGLYRTSLENSTTFWYDGSTWPFRNYASGGSDGSGFCFRMVYNGQWRNTDSTYGYGYVCKSQPDEIETQAPRIRSTVTDRLTNKPKITSPLSIISTKNYYSTVETATRTIPITGTSKRTIDSTLNTATISNLPAVKVAEVTFRTERSSNMTTTEATTTGPSKHVHEPVSTITTNQAMVDATTESTVYSKMNSPPTTKPQTATVAPATKCCCRCCIVVGGKESCNSCSNKTVEESKVCATDGRVQQPSTTLSPLTVQPPVFRSRDAPFAAPSPLTGSDFPQRFTRTSSFLEGEQLMEKLTYLTEKERIQLGHQLENMMLDCRYNDDRCFPRDFTVFNNPLHGNCYVFNSGSNESDHLRKATHSSSGLHMILNIEQPEYIPRTGDLAGVRLVLLSQGQMPFPEDDGTIIKPGLHTSIAIKQNAAFLLSSPYGNCIESSQQADIQKAAFESSYPVKYSKKACIKTCLQSNVIQRCLCVDSYLPHGSAFGWPDIKPCSATNISQDDCRYSVMKDFGENKLRCNCPNLCKQISYSYKLSFSAWPSVSHKVQLLQSLSRSGDLNLNWSDAEVVADNLLSLNIHFEDLSQEILQELPKYPLISFACDIGAVLGLWFGFTLLTSLEFFEFFVDTLVLATRKLFLTA